MKIEKIAENMIFKNYNALCEMLEVKPKRGDSKKAQLKQIESYFRLQKSGHSFTVMEVYEHQNEIVDNRGGSGVYNELLPLIITDYLIGREQSLHYITRSALLTSVQLINKNYSYGSKNRKEISMKANVNEEVVHDFYNTSNSNFKNILETALNKLQKQRILRHFNVLMIMVENEKDKGLVEADNWTIETLLEFEKEALNDLGLQNMMQVRMNPYTWDRHSRLVVNKFNKSHPDFGLKYYFSSYKIIVNTKHIEEDHNRMLLQAMDTIERSNKRSKLNEMLCERLLENAKKRKAAGTTKNDRLLQTRQSFSYVDDSKRLIELLVDRNCVVDIEKTTDSNSL